MSQLATQPSFILCSACPAHSHHGFLDSQRGMSDEPESSPGHDPFQALPSAHLLLPVSLPATFRVEGWGHLLAVCPCHLRHRPSPYQAPTGHQGNCGQTQGSFLFFVFFSTRNFYQEYHVARPHFPWEQRSAGQRVGREGNACAWAKSGWGTSPFCPSCCPRHRSPQMYGCSSLTANPQRFLYSPQHKTGFPHPRNGYSHWTLPAACLTP